MAKDQARVRTYQGQNAHEAGEAFAADAQIAATHGFRPTSQKWDGKALTVVYQPEGAGSEQRGLTAGTMLAIFGAALMALGVFLPWLTVSDATETLILNGIQPFLDGNQSAFDGVIVLIAAATLAVAGLKSSRILAAIGAIVGIAVAFANLFGIRDHLDETLAASEFAGIEGDAGIGLWVIIAGGALGLIGAILFKDRQETS